MEDREAVDRDMDMLIEQQDDDEDGGGGGGGGEDDDRGEGAGTGTGTGMDGVRPATRAAEMELDAAATSGPEACKPACAPGAVR